MAHIQGPAAVHGESVSSLSVDFASPPTVGNRIVASAALLHAAAPMTVIADDGGNLYTEHVTRALTSTGLDRVAIHSAPVVTAGASFTVTLTKQGGGTVDYMALAINEYSGLGTALPITNSAEGNGTAVTGGPAAPAGNGTYVGAMLYQGGGATIAVDSDATWTQRQEQEDPNFRTIAVEDKLSTGSQTPDWVLSVAQDWVALVAGFSDTALVGGGPVDDRHRFRRSSRVSYSAAHQVLSSAVWPEDARDFGERDAIADNRTRML